MEQINKSVAFVIMMFVLSQITKPSANLEYGRVDLAQLFGSVIATVTSGNGFERVKG